MVTLDETLFLDEKVHKEYYILFPHVFFLLLLHASH